MKIKPLKDYKKKRNIPFFLYFAVYIDKTQWGEKMKMRIWNHQRVQHAKEEYPKLEFQVSPWYATGTPTKKINNVSIRFGYPNSQGISPVCIEGTAEEIEKLIAELKQAVKRNREDQKLTWKEIVDENP